MKFAQLYLMRKVEIEEIENYIEQWHLSNSNESLIKYLGLTTSEYSNWVSHGDQFLARMLNNRLYA